MEEIVNEKDVENRLIKPLLAELGYDADDYQQQLYIEIGNHNYALIPDFVIQPILSKGHQSAEFIIESKYSIPSKKELEGAKTQVRSYAKLLGARYAVIVSKERVWVMTHEDDYTDEVLSFSWEELKYGDNFHELFKVIGKGNIKNKTTFIG